LQNLRKINKKKKRKEIKPVTATENRFVAQLKKYYKIKKKLK